MSHLPVVVDPSHGTGRRDIDVYDEPEKALCDGAHAVHPDELAETMGQLRELAKVLGKVMHGSAAEKTRTHSAVP